MHRKPMFSFDSVSSTGIDEVPLNNIILIESTGQQILLTDKTNITSATTITTLLGLTSQYIEMGGGINRSTYHFTATNLQTVFSVAYDDANNVDVFLNGIKMVLNDQYTLSAGTTLTLESGAQAGDIIDVNVYV